MSLKGKVAWITGGGSGIGLAAAQALAAGGATVIISGRRAPALEAGISEIASTGGKAETEPLDVQDAKAVQTTADAIADRHGAIHIIVNSAGMNSTRRFWKGGSIPSTQPEARRRRGVHSATH